MAESEGFSPKDAGTKQKKGGIGIGGSLLVATIIGIPLAAANENKRMHDKRVEEASLANSLLRMQQAEELKKKKKEDGVKPKNPPGMEPLHIPPDGTSPRQGLMEMADLTTPSSLKKHKNDDDVEIPVGEPTKEKLAKPHFTPLPIWISRSTHRSRSTSPPSRATSPTSSGK